MSYEQKYSILGLDEYIRQGEPQKRERSEAWKVAIGLQQVDRLQTSEYLLNIAKRHIEGDISINEAKHLSTHTTSLHLDERLLRMTERKRQIR